MNTGTAYTVKHIQKGPPLAFANYAFCSHLDNKGIGKGWKAK